MLNTLLYYVHRKSHDYESKKCIIKVGISNLLMIDNRKCIINPMMSRSIMFKQNKNNKSD